jgi:hypothetical protein
MNQTTSAAERRIFGRFTAIRRHGFPASKMQPCGYLPQRCDIVQIFTVGITNPQFPFLRAQHGLRGEMHLPETEL